MPERTGMEIARLPSGERVCEERWTLGSLRSSRRQRESQAFSPTKPV